MREPTRSLRPAASALLLGLGVAALAACGAGDSVLDPRAPLRVAPAATRQTQIPVADYTVEWRPGAAAARATLRIVRSDDPARVAWASRPGLAFVAAGRGRERVRESFGSFSVSDLILERCGAQTVASVQAEGGGASVTGSLACPSGPLPYVLRIAPAPESTGQVRLSLRLGRPAMNRSGLLAAADPGERFFGFGEQFTFLELTGRAFPVLVQEQGIGRGAQPLTFLVDLVAGAGGDWWTSYAPVPHLLTDHRRSLLLENSELSRFDLRAPGRVGVEVFSGALDARIAAGHEPLDLLREETAYAGRMRPLPDWIGQGAVLGLQGGTERVRTAWRTAREAGVPLAGVWLQDWVGQRRTSLGEQLWWNWELDRDRYPDWEALVDEIRGDGGHVLLYVNPFLVDVSEKPNARRHLLREARERGLLVRRADGEIAWVGNTAFEAAMLDLTNPAARAWIEEVIRTEMLAIGASGWMADFGEALPWDARLSDGETGAYWHNRYPELWARTNREAIEAAGRGDDAVFFMRSGFTRSPRYATLFWLGDQTVTWDRHDGLASALTGMLSGGLSGFTLDHGDIGGYTGFVRPGLAIRRSRELFQRWAELAAFQLAFRTHEGLLPHANHQFDSDPRTLAHFARMAKLFAAWAPLRRRLVAEAAEQGHPVVRPLFLHYPDDPVTWTLPPTQFLVGRDLLVAPVLAPGRARVRAYVPAGSWVHLWSGCRVASERAARGAWQMLPAPLGEPAVLYREGSESGRELREGLASRGVAAPPPRSCGAGASAGASAPISASRAASSSGR